jgi:perosamine synthetase
MKKTVPPFFLDVNEAEIADIQVRVGEILKSGQLILGKYTEQFENEFARYIGSKYAVALNTATSALEVLCVLHGAKGRKVAVPSNTNFASVAAILRAGGTPVFIDMTKEYFAPDLEILKRAYERYKFDGVMWVHIGGIITPDFLKVVAFCRDEGIFLIEDAAHAHGSRMKGISAGNFADGGAFSFFPTKVMTTMEGGMLTTNNENHAMLAKSFRNQGKRHAAFGGLHYDLGNSWRMSEVSAYIGLIQLKKLDHMISVRKGVADAYSEILAEIGLTYCDTSHMDFASQYKFIVHLNDTHRLDKIKEGLSASGIIAGGGVYEVPCHQQPVFKDLEFSESDLENTKLYCPHHLCPPITSGMFKEEIDLACQALADTLYVAR